MAAPDRWREIRWPLALAALAGLAAGAVLTPGVEDSGDAVADAWDMPAAERLLRVDPGAPAVVSGSPLWRSNERPQATARAAQTWRLVGLVDAPAPAALVVVGAGPEVTRVSPGDELPDGSRVVAVNPTALVVADASGCRRTLQLYRGASASPEASCDTAAPSSEASD